ncbi:hypothetical protein R3P38DRAFT_3234547 [Favolaschia claudopus]|uniref:Uncharacterized protein n=1 Tax=Favolaschia claudopus TaxID=2862362 RepID=A0AAV9ZGJ1_9AGAR
MSTERTAVPSAPTTPPRFQSHAATTANPPVTTFSVSLGKLVIVPQHPPVTQSHPPPNFCLPSSTSMYCAHHVWGRDYIPAGLSPQWLLEDYFQKVGNPFRTEEAEFPAHRMSAPSE